MPPCLSAELTDDVSEHELPPDPDLDGLPDEIAEDPGPVANWR
jgi:hypothetical protein